MGRSKFYKIVIIVLVLINIGTWAFFLTRGPKHGPPKTGELCEELGITGESEQKAILQLEKEHHGKKKLLMARDYELHTQLFSKLGSEEDVSAIQDQIEANYAETETMTYAFFKDVAQYCSQSQLKQLKQMIRRAFQQMRKPPKMKNK